MFAGTALSVRLFVCAGLSLFIICGPYLSVVVCVLYAYNLTQGYGCGIIELDGNVIIPKRLMKNKPKPMPSPPMTPTDEEGKIPHMKS